MVDVDGFAEESSSVEEDSVNARKTAFANFKRQYRQQHE